MLRKFLSIIIILSSGLLSVNAMAETVPYKGIEKINLPSGHSLSVVTEKDFDFVDEQGARRYWKTTLLLSRGKSIAFQQVRKEIDNLKWVYGSIVPIRKGKYYADLNGDGFLEVAILSWDLGMAVYRNTELYTVKESGLVRYGVGKYNLELGPNVLLNCPKCSKFDLAACRLCE